MEDEYEFNLKNQRDFYESERAGLLDRLTEIKAVASELYADRGEDSRTSEMCQKIMELSKW